MNLSASSVSEQTYDGCGGFEIEVIKRATCTERARTHHHMSSRRPGGRGVDGSSAGAERTPRSSGLRITATLPCTFASHASA